MGHAASMKATKQFITVNLGNSECDPRRGSHKAFINCSAIKMIQQVNVVEDMEPTVKIDFLGGKVIYVFSSMEDIEESLFLAGLISNPTN